MQAFFLGGAKIYILFTSLAAAIFKTRKKSCAPFRQMLDFSANMLYNYII